MGSSSKKLYHQFFSVFLPEYCSENLPIPDSFIHHLTHKLPEKVFLRNRLGKLWPVEVVEAEAGFFFHEGWPRLVMENSLQMGEFLVFRYNDVYVFDILILDSSQCEKEQVVPSGRTTALARGEKKTKKPPQEAQHEEAEIEVMDQVGSSARENKLRGRGKNYSVCGYDPVKLKKGIKEFLPEDNLYIVTKLRKCARGGLSIPHSIKKDIKFNENIKLLDPKGREWEGKVVEWNSRRIWVMDAWNELCKWNKVSEQDILICKFMTDRKNICKELKVTIIRDGLALLGPEPKL